VTPAAGSVFFVFRVSTTSGTARNPGNFLEFEIAPGNLLEFS